MSHTDSLPQTLEAWRVSWAKWCRKRTRSSRGFQRCMTDLETQYRFWHERDTLTQTKAGLTGGPLPQRDTRSPG